MVEETSKLERIAGRTTGRVIGIVSGVIATTAYLYNPKLAPYIVASSVGGVIGAIALAIVGFDKEFKDPIMSAIRVIAYGSLASALILGGNYIRKEIRNANKEVLEIHSPIITNNAPKVFVETRPYFELQEEFKKNQQIYSLFTNPQLDSARSVKTKTI